MKPDVREKFIKAAHKHKEPFRDDHSKCRAFLRDEGFESLHANLLSQIVRYGIVKRMTSESKSDFPFAGRAEMYAKILNEEHAIDYKLALWAVECWALALKIVEEDELKAAKKAEQKPAPTPTTPPKPKPAPSTQHNNSQQPTPNYTPPKPPTQPNPVADNTNLGLDSIFGPSKNFKPIYKTVKISKPVLVSVCLLDLILIVFIIWNLVTMP